VAEVTAGAKGEVNRQWRLARRPEGMVRESDFEWVAEPLREPADGEIVVRNLYLAFEPAMRGWLNDEKSYVPPVGIGEVMRSSAVGQVVRSRDPRHREGELVHGMFGWQEYCVTDGRPGPMGGVGRVPDGVEPSWVLGVLGGTGLTAYFGMLEVGRPEPGNVVVVSGAAGATGSIAGQIARIRGASKVIGIAGGERKCRWLTEEAGFTTAIDYKSEDLRARLREECRDAIDVYFDNVGGETLDAVLVNMATFGRIAMCGGISGYNEKELPAGPRHIMQLVIRRCTMQGFLLLDHLARAREARADLSKWIASGELVHAEDVQEGLENAPKTFQRLFRGQNLGKQLLKLGDPS